MRKRERLSLYKKALQDWTNYPGIYPDTHIMVCVCILARFMV